jgi:hypothetical protein
MWIPSLLSQNKRPTTRAGAHVDCDGHHRRTERGSAYDNLTNQLAAVPHLCLIAVRRNNRRG